MRFGILDSDTDPAAVIERAERAEELGFSSFFVGHHRFTPGFGDLCLEPRLVHRASRQRPARQRDEIAAAVVREYGIGR